jgi:uncharacterized membrane protein
MYSRRRLAAFGALVLATAFCVALVGFRMRYSGTSRHYFLIPNLALAWLPFLFALGLYDGVRRGRPRLQLGLLVAAWLLFLPNAPYVITDLIHLESLPPVPLWYDAMMFGACAWTGLALGMASLLLVHRVARDTIGEKLSWALLVPTLALVSLGIYLGRFVRLNSWDAVLRPGRVAHVIATPLTDPSAHPRFVGVVVLFTVFLILVYLVVYTVLELRLEPAERASPEERRRI